MIAVNQRFGDSFIRGIRDYFYYRVREIGLFFKTY